jgi:hypothetical protein
MFNTVVRWLFLAVPVAALVACGGGGADADPAAAAARSEQALAVGPSTTWVPCAVEGEVCTLPSSGDNTILYGVDATSGRSVTRDFSNVPSIACGNDTFGDPAFGIVKKCFYAVTPPPPSSTTWTFCAAEGDVCRLPRAGTYSVRYVVDGTTGAAVTRTFSNVISFGCGNDTFGDPAFGIVKQCYYAADAPPPPPPSDWTLCGVENSVCALPGVGNYMVLYGADSTSGRSVTRSFLGVGSVACNNDTFGDPAFGIVKQCFYKVADANAALVDPPITPPALAADGTLLWPVPVHASPLALQVRPFATLPSPPQVSRRG